MLKLRSVENLVIWILGLIRGHRVFWKTDSPIYRKLVEDNIGMSYPNLDQSLVHPIECPCEACTTPQRDRKQEFEFHEGELKKRNAKTKVKQQLKFEQACKQYPAVNDCVQDLRWSRKIYSFFKQLTGVNNPIKEFEL